MPRINFQEVSVQATRYWKDPVTGKKRQETRKFYQTISPFNRNPDGSLKTREQITTEIMAERSEWLRQ